VQNSGFSGQDIEERLTSIKEIQTHKRILTLFARHFSDILCLSPAEGRILQKY